MNDAKPAPCDHSIDQLSECCSYCGLSAECILYQERTGAMSDAHLTSRYGQPEPKRTDPQCKSCKCLSLRSDRCSNCGCTFVNLDGSDDPYTKHRLAIDGELTLRAMSDRPGSEAARLRNIAALRSEMGRPLPQKHPSEGRSDRVTGYRRW